jgi:hypothetical protein
VWFYFQCTSPFQASTFTHVIRERKLASKLPRALNDVELQDFTSTTTGPATSST